MTKTSEKSKHAESSDTGKKPYRPPFYSSFRLEKSVKTESTVPGSFRIFKDAIMLLKQHAKLFLCIAAIYGILYLLLVQGLTNLNGLEEARNRLEDSIAGGFVDLTAGVTLYVQLLGMPAMSGSAANFYQFVVTLLASLALIWTFRQVYAGHKVRARDGYYQGMYPLVPFLLILGLVAVQLIPFAIGGSVFALVVRNGIAATGIEIFLWGVGFFVLALISLYMIVSSVLALYIVTLPNMRPLQALRSAHELVQGRRWLLMRKMLFLPLTLIVLVGSIMVPLIMFITPIVGWMFFALMVISLAVGHSYMYRLYRSLL